MTDKPDYPGMPRWVKRSIFIGALLIAAIVTHKMWFGPHFLHGW